MISSDHGHQRDGRLPAPPQHVHQIRVGTIAMSGHKAALAFLCVSHSSSAA